MFGSRQTEKLGEGVSVMKKIIAEYTFSAEERLRVKALAKCCGLHEVTASILYSRGVDTPEKAERFLHPSRKNLLSPFLMRGMRELKEEIDRVKSEGKLVVVYGDYDADGIGAASILTSALRAYGVHCMAHIPERSEGYGMTVPALEKLISENGPALIVTVDCGISNRECVEYIKSRGVKVIVTDHHELPDKLPDCTIVNPKLADDYPYDNLCGAGVAFKIACALLGERAYDLMDLAAISTVADSVPLTGENRDIVYEGLKLINRRPRAAIRNLLSGRKDETTAQTLAFTIAPRVNAAGRMGDANCALRLFTAESAEEVYDLSCRLNEYNLERQQLCDEVYRSAKEQIRKQGAYGNVIMLCDESWSAGLIGIVAARISEEFNRPAILFVKNGDCLKGSARTIENVNIYEALKACSEHIKEFGGHAQAAGVNIRAEEFEPLKQALDEYIGKTYTKEDFIPSVAVCEEEGLVFDLAFAQELERLEPFGVGNKRPLFKLETEKTAARRLKDGSPHISIRADGLDLVWFGGESALPLLGSDICKTLVFECGISRFKGKESVRGLVKEMLCGTAGGESTELYKFRNNLLRLTQPEVSVTAQKESSEQICARISAARNSCNYGLLLVCSEKVPLQFAQAVEGLETDLFHLSSQNIGNAVLISPAADVAVSLYRDVIFLDNPADFHLKELAGKKIVVNREICGYNDIAQLETSRAVMSEIYRGLKSGTECEDSVDFALASGLAFPHTQIIFALEVFLELGFFRFERGRLVAVHGKKSDLKLSKLYCAVCALKEGS